MSRARRRWGAVAAWALGVFLLSARTHLPSAPWLLGWDKLQHAAEYALGGWLLARALAWHPRWATWALALGSLYALSDELHQSFVPGRSCDLRDWAADNLGLLLAICLVHLLTLPRTRRGLHAAPPGAEPLTP